MFTSIKRKRDGLLAAAEVGSAQVVAARVEAQPQPAHLRLKEHPLHMLLSDSHFAQPLQASLGHDINILHWQVVRLLDPQGASGGQEDSVGALGDLRVVLETPVWGAREAVSGGALSRVSTKLSSDHRAKEEDGILQGWTQLLGELGSTHVHCLDEDAGAESK